MGSVSLKIGDETARFKKPTICSSPTNILMLFSVITTNLFALYAFKYAQKPHNHHLLPHHHHHTHKTISLISEQVFFILKEIDSSQKKLSQIETHLLGFESIDLSTPTIPKELKSFLNRHQLPLGKDSKTGITEMVSSVGHSCVKSIDLLSEFMNYNINGVCPDDWNLSQKLILRGCEPLPRRRCLSRIHSLNSKKLNGHCFDLVKGYESRRFLKPRGKNDFLIDEVLALGGNGGIRIGFDIGGGCGTFAARMAEKNVTIVTTTSNMDAHSSEFIAARGLFPLYLSSDHRFPFYENVFDIVHAGDGFGIGDDALEKSKLEFLMFDVDRILRPGGLLWLDNFLCSNEENRRNLTHLIDVFGYKKHKWVVGEKVNGSGKFDVYLSAILQKPIRA
ncbi:uncharacterized protein LOC112525328 [Cynara cardunculus var. scolymus]|uniref:Putative S-adenosyl-L-methionine-dependent methyltransferase n=1 Tax=Cynara cardunculus var. scolymus TaxID=59895 RepID=A0A103YEV0_CYNCS|nr:uncharacterized protein LOC112525328 [Cynara cardunculus var. scolymus]KVI07805.1 putative S-adenosyl-L-methionine-dependent methyltransferase [Cynara cardunculus var. scolymus]